MLSGVLRELADTPVPSSAAASSVGMNNFVPVDEFGSAKDCAEDVYKRQMMDTARHFVPVEDVIMLRQPNRGLSSMTPQGMPPSLYWAWSYSSVFLA